VFGCGFYDLTSSAERLAKMPPDEAGRWLKQLDPGRRAAGIKAPFFIAAATNDFFFYPRAVQMTLDAIPGEKNQLYAPNANHKAPVPGGMAPPKAEGKPFQPTPFQPHPTPGGTKGNWLAMEVPFFEYHLRGRGEPLPKITVVRGGNPRTARFRIASPRPVAAPDVYWAPAEPDPKKRVWSAVAARAGADGIYEAQLPETATDWFALASDDRPVTVAGDLTPVAPAAK
jgi:hypothetical protein